MTPKVTYVLNSVLSTITFSPNDHALFSQEWERDEVEYKNPFSGEKTRKCRGHYYKATIAFDAVPYTLIDGYRDLFNINTTSIRFYPSADAVESYECDVNENISADDAHVSLSYRNVEIVFRSKKRFDSALNYPNTYWGARRSIFSGSQTMETHRTELNADDATNRDSYNAIETSAVGHLATGHVALYYTKDEVETLLAITGKQVYSFCELYEPDEPDKFQRLVNEFNSRSLHSDAGLPSAVQIVGDGTVTRIAYFENGESNWSYDSGVLAIAVTAGQLLRIYPIFSKVGSTYYMQLKASVDGVVVASSSSRSWAASPSLIRVSVSVLQSLS